MCNWKTFHRDSTYEFCFDCMTYRDTKYEDRVWRLAISDRVALFNGQHVHKWLNDEMVAIYTRWLTKTLILEEETQ